MPCQTHVLILLFRFFFFVGTVFAAFLWGETLSWFSPSSWLSNQNDRLPLPRRLGNPTVSAFLKEILQESGSKKPLCHEMLSPWTVWTLAMGHSMAASWKLETMRAKNPQQLWVIVVGSFCLWLVVCVLSPEVAGSCRRGLCPSKIWSLGRTSPEMFSAGNDCIY